MAERGGRIGLAATAGAVLAGAVLLTLWWAQPPAPDPRTDATRLARVAEQEREHRRRALARVERRDRDAPPPRAAPAVVDPDLCAELQVLGRAALDGRLRPDEVRCLAARAEAGDGDAASLLAMHASATGEEGLLETALLQRDDAQAHYQLAVHYARADQHEAAFHHASRALADVGRIPAPQRAGHVESLHRVRTRAAQHLLAEQGDAAAQERLAEASRAWLRAGGGGAFARDLCVGVADAAYCDEPVD